MSEFEFLLSSQSIFFSLYSSLRLWEILRIPFSISMPELHTMDWYRCENIFRNVWHLERVLKSTRWQKKNLLESKQGSKKSKISSSMFSMFYSYFNLSVHRMTFLPLSIHESCFFIRHMSRSSLMNFKSIHSLMSSRSIKDSAEL